MSVARELAGAEWRARTGAYLVLAALLTLTSTTYAFVFASLTGLEEGLGGELSDALGADVRVAPEAGVSSSRMIEGADDLAVRLRSAVPGTQTAIRLETEALLLHGAAFTAVPPGDDPDITRSATMLVGIDAVGDDALTGFSRFVKHGVTLHEAQTIYTPLGERLMPIVIGREMAERNNLSVADDGAFSWQSVVNVTAGRTQGDRLITTIAIVVGTYDTGFNLLDRGLAYAPRADVGRLLGQHPGNPSANVIIARTPSPDALVAVGEAAGYVAVSARDFRFDYLGPVFVAVRVVAWTVVVALTALTAGWFAHTLGHHVHEDRRKIATLRAIGVPARDVDASYHALAATLAGVGVVVGLAATVLLALGVRLITAATLTGGPFTPRVGALDALGLLVLSLGSSAFATRVALRRTRRIDVREALA